MAGLADFNPYMATADLLGIGIGAFQRSQAMSGLRQLGQAPQLQESPEVRDAYNRANRESQYGFDPAQNAYMEQQRAQQGNLAFHRGLNYGGGSQAAALNAGINAMQLPSINQQGYQDAMLKNNKFKFSYTIANALQHQSNLTQQLKHQDYMQAARALGTSASQGLMNIGNNLTSIPLAFGGRPQLPPTGLGQNNYYFGGGGYGGGGQTGMWDTGAGNMPEGQPSDSGVNQTIPDNLS